jgi:hypothetical protein
VELTYDEKDKTMVPPIPDAATLSAQDISMHVSSEPKSAEVAEKKSVSYPLEPVPVQIDLYAKQPPESPSAVIKEDIPALKLSQSLPAPKEPLILKVPKILLKKPKPLRELEEQIRSKTNTPTPSRPVSPQTQSDTAFRQICSQILACLENHPCAHSFLQPVDDSFAPGYSTIIKRSMDLATLRNNLEKGVFKNDIDAFLMDACLIFQNCYTYNTDDSPVTHLAQSLEKAFRSIVASLLPEKASILRTERHILPSSQPLLPTLEVVPSSSSSSPALVAVADDKAVLLSGPEFDSCQAILKKLVQHPLSSWFQAPVRILYF